MMGHAHSALPGLTDSTVTDSTAAAVARSAKLFMLQNAVKKAFRRTGRNGAQLRVCSQ